MNLLFAQPWMLLWAVAALIPLILFLLRKRTAQTIQWGAMQFLQTASRGPAPRPPWRRLLLLLTRMAIPVVVALAAATPGCLQTSGGAAGNFADPVATHYVFVFDLSGSMGPRADRDAASPARQSIDSALQQLSATQQGDLFSVITSGAAAPTGLVVAATADRDRASNVMRNLQAGYATFRPQTVMNAIAESIDQTSQRGLNVDHQIIIYSDFAVADWSDEDVLSPSGLDEITTTFRLVDRSAKPGPNLAITDLRTSAGRSTVGQSIIVEASVRVLGQASPRLGNTVVPRTTNVELTVDGVSVARRSLDVIGSEIGTISFDVPVDRNGPIPVTARIDDSGLLADDQRHLVIVGQAAIQVLIVEGGNQLPNPLTTALSGTDRQGSDKPDVELATIEPSQLATARLDRPDVIALTGMSSIDDSQRKKLVEFTRRGGRLLISLGEIAQRATWQALLDDLGAGVELTDGVQKGNFGFDPLEYEHPAIGAFRDFPDAGLLDVPIYRYHPTVLTGPEIDRILNYDDGQAAIVTFTAGQGRVVLTTTPLVAADPDSPWNNLPAWWSYVPLVNELVFWLFAGEDSHANRTSLVGQGLVVDASEFPFSQRIEIRHSNGDVNFVSPNADTIVVEPHQVVEPGFVEIGADQGETAGASPAPLFAFNFDLQESDPQSVDVGALQSRLNQEPASSDSGQAKSIGYRDRWPLQLCLTMLLMLLVVEWALASRTGIAVRKEAS